MMPILGPPILATGYDPYSPTKESIDAAKKACKKERGIAKLLILSDNYGSGVKKKQKILSLNGIEMSLYEVEDMHRALLNAKSGVVQYVEWLTDQWKINKGWVENGYGRPICVDEKYLKDILNRCLAEGTLVHTKRGLVSIEQITKDDLVWDGHEWVTHAGVVFKGLQEVITINNVDMTPDHDIFIDEYNKKEAQHVGQLDSVLETTPGNNWTMLWGLCCSIARLLAKKWKGSRLR